MEYTKKRNNILIFLSLIITCCLISIFLKINIMLLAQIGFLGFIFFLYLWKDEERLLYYSITISIISAFLGSFFGAFAYLPQIFLILLTIKLLEMVFIKKISLKIDKLILSIAFFMISLDTALYLVNTQGNIILYIWTILKKYGFLIIYIYILNLNNTKNLLLTIDKIFKLMFIIQFIWTFIQFKNNVFFDDITGVFGRRSTGEYATFLIIYLLILLNRSNKNKNDMWFIVFLSLHILIYSVIAEVKLLMILFPLIIVLNILLKRKKIIDFIYILIILGLLGIGYDIYISLYPEQALQDSYSVDKYLTKSYGVHTELNRLSCLGPLEKNGVLNGSMEKIFGKGLGMVHPSDMSLVQGPLYKQYEYLKIEWFTLPYLITESGIVGTMLYISIYIIILIRMIINLSKNNCRTLLCISVVSIIIIIYNSSMITSLRVPMFIWMWIGLLSKSNYSLKI